MCDTCLDQKLIVGADGRVKPCPVCNVVPVIVKKSAPANMHQHQQRGPAQTGYNARDSRRMADKFVAFHRANPQVWDEIKHMVMAQIYDGASRVSMYDIYEDLRKSSLRTSGEAFKLNNNHAAIYAHMFCSEYPQYAGRFELRRSEIAIQALAMLKEDAE